MKKTKIKKDLFNRIKEIGSENKIRGITLISLIVTIIILLILAGVTIATLNNSNLFDKSKLAREKYEIAKDDEENKLDDYSNRIDNYKVAENGRDTVTISKEEYDELKEKQEWKFIASANSTNPVDISNFKINNLCVKVYQPIAGSALLNLPFIALENGGNSYVIGNQGRNGWVNVTKQSVSLSYYGYDSTNCTASSMIFVYYN